MTFAAGLAAGGLRPVVAIYSSFMQRAYDQILHDVCIQNLPVILCLDRAGLVGDDGPTHHGVFDLSFLRMIPGIVVMAPSSAQELADMLLTAVQHDGPSAIRYPRGSCPAPWQKRAPEALPIGRGETLRAGEDIAIVAVGPQAGCPRPRRGSRRTEFRPSHQRAVREASGRAAHLQAAGRCGRR